MNTIILNGILQIKSELYMINKIWCSIWVLCSIDKLHPSVYTFVTPYNSYRQQDFKSASFVSRPWFCNYLHIRWCYTWPRYGMLIKAGLIKRVQKLVVKLYFMHCEFVTWEDTQPFLFDVMMMISTCFSLKWITISTYLYEIWNCVLSQSYVRCLHLFLHLHSYLFKSIR